MCLACEQDAMWFAYLQRKGLITPDGFLVEQPPSPLFADPIDAAPPKQENEKQEQNAGEPADKSKFSCDDPTAG
jgi:hypothetical protein